ncbi:MAG: hypothetical protein BGO51_00515 [Rhodospirillales bacterium 69-11]|jgi:hypothetical protein|nr:MAG: hypothetical protein BGO51_00515 [Rhodospirillales bacterium 69-11]
MRRPRPARRQPVRSKTPEVPEVPTVSAAPAPEATPEPAPDTAEQEADAAIRKMVEAAYT